MKMKGFTTCALLLCSSSLFSLVIFSGAADTITTSQSIRDAGDTIVSAGVRFQLGFFSPGNSKNRYLGIWHAEISPVTAVWVANRETPLLDSSGVLIINNQGNLVLLNGTHQIIWSSNSPAPTRSPIAQLLDSGNLVVIDGNDAQNPENILWQSFDHPRDTLLPGMKIGRNKITGQEWYLSSGKSNDDPSQGAFTIRVDSHGFPQLDISKDSTVIAKSGPWNGIRFSESPGFGPNPYFKFDFVFNQKELYYSFEMYNRSLISRLVLNQTGTLQRFLWRDRDQGWVLILTVAMGNCFRQAVCGPFGTCNNDNLPFCKCLRGFEPKFPKDWETTDWSKGCVRKTPLSCPNGDGFFKFSAGRLPDTLNYWYNGSMNLEECRMMCLKNCSCMAYANSDMKGGGSGCLIWFDELIDMRETINNGQDIYIRMAASELDQGDNIVKFSNDSSMSKQVKIIVSSGVSMGVLLLGIILILLRRKTKHLLRDGKIRFYMEKENVELPLFDFSTMENATDNFSTQNKLGEGGFGVVFKGMLKDGQEIAVKRLSRNSSQGLDEFKSEVMHIAKVQHRNLVKLLGCCIQGDEKMLVYEYMFNNSLDTLIFDERNKMLDWPKRFHIINGVARGLLYLHQDSRLRIIHRDLKASNVLLDNEMNPKISDFGMARTFGANESEAKTRRVVGTYGYMSPEYAINGCYSMKSDVFSFGVLVLETVSGKRNRGFNHPNHCLNLLGHAWKLYMEDKCMELIDASLGDLCNMHEVLRSIHLGLLCVQHHPEDRPSMSSVVLMLSGEGALPPPKQPGFFFDGDLQGICTSRKSRPSSSNQVTMTLLEAR
ncbi:G-type lectin S-receptor-like serine/threonine-protein kinase At4g27290 [Malania oleifera]|uniref:G-type lectin S-receptor-like serine/threonine-protein kinase At4g27290 n=1 Tax=Malania oleifera TaxID=397392 RepID=UPI0025AD9CE1|nr:G-type lectin S-receptor-like serine/threonine-protein kinase At4g27290 [Malania oleifera]